MPPPTDSPLPPPGSAGSVRPLPPVDLRGIAACQEDRDAAEDWLNMLTSLADPGDADEEIAAVREELREAADGVSQHLSHLDADQLGELRAQAGARCEARSGFSFLPGDPRPIPVDIVHASRTEFEFQRDVGVIRACTAELQIRAERGRGGELNEVPPRTNPDRSGRPPRPDPFAGRMPVPDR